MKRRDSILSMLGAIGAAAIPWKEAEALTDDEFDDSLGRDTHWLGGQLLRGKFSNYEIIDKRYKKLTRLPPEKLPATDSFNHYLMSLESMLQGHGEFGIFVLTTPEDRMKSVCGSPVGGKFGPAPRKSGVTTVRYAVDGTEILGPCNFDIEKIARNLEAGNFMSFECFMTRRAVVSAKHAKTWLSAQPARKLPSSDCRARVLFDPYAFYIYWD